MLLTNLVVTFVNLLKITIVNRFLNFVYYNCKLTPLKPQLSSHTNHHKLFYLHIIKFKYLKSIYYNI